MNRLRTKMLLYIWGVTALLFVVVIVLGFLDSRQHDLRQLRTAALNQAGREADRIAQPFQATSSAVNALAPSVVRSRHNAAVLRNIMDRILAVRPEIVSVALAFPKAPFLPNHGPETIRRTRDGETISHSAPRLAPVPRTPKWSRPKLEGRSLISEYDRQIDDFAHHPMAMLSVRLSLDESVKEIERVSREGASYAFIYDSHGRVAAIPNVNLLFSPLGQLSADLKPHQTGLSHPVFLKATDPLHHEPSWIQLAPIPKTGLSLGVVYLVRSELARLYHLEDRMIALVVLGLVVLFGVVFLVSDSVSKPIAELADSARAISEGEVEFSLTAPPGSTAEVLELTRAFNRMLGALQDHVKQLQQTTREKQRFESELDIAARIQRSFLPTDLLQDDRFRIWAVSEPAREVGGDIYDFFTTADGRLGFCVGDVSGKGVPAALFVTACRTLLHAQASQNVPPDECLNRVNRTLYGLLDPGMFVTLFYALLDLRDGRLLYANAGHHMPILGGPYENGPLARPGGLPLGVLRDGRYELGSVTLREGAELFLYSDGLTEAANSSREQFGDERLLQTVRGLTGKPARQRIVGVLEAVGQFVGDVPRADDLTVLAVDYLGSSS